MRQEKPKVNLRKGEEFTAHRCGSVHFALTRQGKTIRGYCVQCNGLVLETRDTEMHYSDDEAVKKIREAYGEGSLILIYAEAAANRVGSGHEEVVKDGEPVCATCGVVARGTADPVFHPEAYT